MADEPHDEREDAARRAREDMHAATDRLRARLDALRRRIRDELDPPPTDARSRGSAPSR